MGTAGFGGSFAPIVQYEKWEIHPVFPHFSYFRLCQNLSPNPLAPLCGAALGILEMYYPKGTSVNRLRLRDFHPIECALTGRTPNREAHQRKVGVLLYWGGL